VLGRGGGRGKQEIGVNLKNWQTAAKKIVKGLRQLFVCSDAKKQTKTLTELKFQPFCPHKKIIVPLKKVFK
jgi:hypothetical protein